MPLIDWEIWLSDVLLGYIDFDGHTYKFCKRIDGASSIEILSSNKYLTLNECILGISKLFQFQALPHLNVWRRENQRKIRKLSMQEIFCG